MEEGFLVLDNTQYAYRLGKLEDGYIVRISDSELVKKFKEDDKGYLKLAPRQMRKSYINAWAKIISSISQEYRLSSFVDVCPPNFYFNKEHNRYEQEIEDLYNHVNHELIYLTPKNERGLVNVLLRIENHYDSLLELMESYFEDENLEILLVDVAIVNLKSLVQLLYPYVKRPYLPLEIFRMGVKFHFKSAALSRQLICVSDRIDLLRDAISHLKT